MTPPSTASDKSNVEVKLEPKITAAVEGALGPWIIATLLDVTEVPFTEHEAVFTFAT